MLRHVAPNLAPLMKKEFQDVSGLFHANMVSVVEFMQATFLKRPRLQNTANGLHLPWPSRRNVFLLIGWLVCCLFLFFCFVYWLVVCAMVIF